jgi:hypothetical protein
VHSACPAELRPPGEPIVTAANTFVLFLLGVTVNRRFGLFQSPPIGMAIALPE